MSNETVSNPPKITLLLGGARSGKSRLAEELAYKRATEPNGVLYVATLQPGDDEEMRDRVARHRAARPATWRTLETPFDLAETVLERLQNEQIVLLDCLTVWTSNRLIREDGTLTNHLGEIHDDQPSVKVATNGQSASSSSSLEPDREETITSDLQDELRSVRLARPAPPNKPDYARLETALIAELETLINGLRQRGVGGLIVSNEVGLALVPPYPLGRIYRDLLGRVNQRVAQLADEVFMVFAGLPVELKKLQATLE